ncbi:adhesion G protein-coupled receptor E2 isoform X6 [Pimephales promelas]|uniref:adhesion G protein-coupled receptor E2 isoform X6 n=1 Tax=Pimephales promelas TaxID=90988 RepID=UPI0019555E8D|nr:adhesion G protein-coupled receptor E2 isoform X6 [Pimephales promelas]
MRNMYLLSLGLLLALTENIMKVTTCDIGLSKIKGKCIDDNECESIQPPVCGEDAICFNTYGSFYCHCNGGFEPTHNFTQTDGIKCEDINECTDGSAVCGPNAVCANSAGGYLCTCKYGYISSNGEELFITEDGVQCIGVCDIDKSICGEGTCTNSKDGHECVCKSGFTNYGHKQMKCTGSKISVLHILSSVLAACPYLLVTVVLIYKCCRMRALLLRNAEVGSVSTPVYGHCCLPTLFSSTNSLPAYVYYY